MLRHRIFTFNKMISTSLALTFVSLALAGCQTTPKAQKPIAVTPILTTSPTVATGTSIVTLPATAPVAPLRFDVNGKFGIVTPKEAGSAFYTWSQVGNGFLIDLEGAFGLGHFRVEYNGQTATMTNQKGQTKTASTPEELLRRVTGWQAPISLLPYWIMGQNAPNDTSSSRDTQQRLALASNAGWTANFIYNGNDKQPNKLIMVHQNGTKATMTINHL